MGKTPNGHHFGRKAGHVDFLLLGRLIKRFAKPFFFHSFWVVSKPVFFFFENLGDDDPGTSRQEVSWQGVLPDVVESTRSCLETMVTGDRGEFHRTKGLI